MKSTTSLLVVLVVLTAGVMACQTYWYANPTIPVPAGGANNNATCKAPPIGKNIIGKWKVGIKRSLIGDTVSRYAPLTIATFEEIGTLIFDTNNRVSDPDSLLPNHLDLDGRGTLVYFGYSIETDTVRNSAYSKYGELFWIRQYYKKDKYTTALGTGYYQKVITNECNRVHLKGDALELVLVR